MLPLRCLPLPPFVGLVCLAALSAFDSTARAQISVDFDQDTYVVSGPGETIDIEIRIDGVSGTEVLEPVRRGLFSFAVRMDFDSTKATLGDTGSVQSAPELDFFQISPGAYEAVEPGWGGVKGNIDPRSEPLEPYPLPLLARFTLTNLASAPDNYPLELSFFNTVGPNEAFFLDGEGAVLDGIIELGTARVIVVPEPAGAGVLLLTLLAVAGRMRRCRVRLMGG